jgi:hypothetical protein
MGTVLAATTPNLLPSWLIRFTYATQFVTTYVQAWLIYALFTESPIASRVAHVLGTAVFILYRIPFVTPNRESPSWRPPRDRTILVWFVSHLQCTIGPLHFWFRRLPESTNDDSVGTYCILAAVVYVMWNRYCLFTLHTQRDDYEPYGFIAIVTGLTLL